MEGELRGLLLKLESCVTRGGGGGMESEVVGAAASPSPPMLALLPEVLETRVSLVLLRDTFWFRDVDTALPRKGMFGMCT